MLYFKLRWLPGEFEKYCSDVEHTAAWGGQLEVSGSGFSVPVRLSLQQLLQKLVCALFVFQLRALTQILQLPIEVVQASSAAIKIGEEFDSEPITLVYVITSAVPPEKTQLHIHGCLRDHLHEPMRRYMRHAYGLGEHYNSVERLKDPANADGSWQTPHSRISWDDLPLLNDNHASQAKDVRGALKSTSLLVRILGNDDDDDFPLDLGQSPVEQLTHANTETLGPFTVLLERTDVQPVNRVSVIWTSNLMSLPIK